jgi:hypothetical protein
MLCFANHRINQSGIILFMKFWRGFSSLLLVIICILSLSQSVFIPQDITDKVRQYTGTLEFNYFNWTVDSLLLKLGESGIHLPENLSADTQHRLVLNYFSLVKDEETLAAKIEQIYADPSVKDPKQAATDDLAQQAQYQAMLDELAPVTEEVLQSEVTETLSAAGLTLGGQAIPSLLYHTTPLPKALIVSPRDTIRQDTNLSLLANLSLAQITDLENKISTNLDVSALVVDIGGVGIYPTMVMQSSDPTWVINTIAHEWTHNFLTLRPLGLNYDTNNPLRTMNETTAEIVGTEIGKMVIERYYPELKSASFLPTRSMTGLADAATPPGTFDFNAEMHTTRVTADQLLKEGKITEAENYMEMRRQVFVSNGYLIRKINQAYFAFYGAYAENPVGAAGEDPVGPAVRQLRAQSSSLADFLNRISWMTSFEQLQKSVKANQ